MGRTPANKGGTFSVADLNSAAVTFVGLLLQDDELRQAVLDVRQRFARGIKSLRKRFREEFSDQSRILEAEARRQSPYNFGPLTWLEKEESDRSWRLARKYETEIPEALDDLGVRSGWLPGLLLKPPSAGLFGDLAPYPFFRPVQLSGVKGDDSDLVALLKSFLPDPNPPPDQSSDAGIVSIEFTYAPSKDTRKGMERLALREVRHQLDVIDEHWQAHNELSSRPRKRPELNKHVSWLYQRLVEKRPWQKIANGESPKVDISTARDAARNLAEALGIDLPLGKPGRRPKPKHKS